MSIFYDVAIAIDIWWGTGSIFDDTILLYIILVRIKNFLIPGPASLRA